MRKHGVDVIYCDTVFFSVVCWGWVFGDGAGERPRATQTDVGRRRASIFTAPGLRIAPRFDPALLGVLSIPALSF